MNYPRSFLILILFYIGVFAFTQSTKIDSLKAIVEDLEEDTARIKVLNEMAFILYRTAPEEAIKYSTDAKNLAEQVEFQPGLADAYKNIGLGYFMQGNYTEAFRNWEPALRIYEVLGDDQYIANILGNQASIYYTIGDYIQAIEFNLQALKIAEKLNDSVRLATLYLNIGSVYSEQPAKYDTALSYYSRALKIGEAIEYIELVGIGSINMGELYFKKEAYDSALFYIEQSLALLSGNIDIAASLNFLGRIYAEQGEYQTAIEYQLDALDMAQKEQAQREEVRIFLGLASTYLKQGNPQRAIYCYDHAKSTAKEIGLNYELSEAYQGLANSFSEIEDFQNAYQYLALQNKIEETIHSIEIEEKTSGAMFTFQLNKKQDEIEILEKESIIEQLRSKKQRGISIAAGSIGILLLMLAGGFYNRFLFIRKTSKKINTQKDEIESQRDAIQAARDQLQIQHDTVFSQKELITDSITYAQRIQSAILPSQKLLDELLPESFILFKPKDIVSGDFYWIKKVQDHLVIVEADCTGHGVPGAFMSMLGITLLNDLIGDKCFDAPGAILDKLRMKIKEMLVQEGNVEDQKDGMDMAIAILDKNTRQVHFSGANNPLYIIRNKEINPGQQLEPHLAMENGKYHLYELKGDKQPIGVHWEETNFTNHTISLQENDTIYIFSDGIVDQFGGENRKKFKSINFKKLLLSIQEESMKNQRQILDDTFEAWKGSYEQIDDVSVFGVKI